jgi:polysaccharide pyruvyl transferase WcaK-like protein
VTKPTLTVGLLGHSLGSDNLGVTALTLSNIAIAIKVSGQAQTNLRFVLLASQDADRSYVTGVDIETVPLRTRAYVAPRNGLFNAVRRCDLVLDIAGGDSFADIYGTERFIRIALSKAITILARRPLILSPQTIGPFQRGWTRWLAIQSMRRSEAVVSRDQLTTEFLAPMGLGSKLVEATDVAFRLPFERSSRPPGKARVGLNISGLLFNGGYTRSNMFALKVDYRALARGLLAHFAGQPNCEVHLISHVISEAYPVEDDFRVAQQLAVEFPGVVVAPRFTGPSEAKSYISGMDFFAGSRMHACIAALSSGVAVLPIAYSRKFQGVFGSLGYPMVADCRSESAEDIIQKSIDAYNQRDSLRDAIEAALSIIDEKLARYENVLLRCFGQAILHRSRQTSSSDWGRVSQERPICS